MQAAGARDVLAIDVSAGMLAKSRERFGAPPLLGNEAAVRFWHGDMAQVPRYLGGADVIFVNAVFGNVVNEHAVLLRATFLLKPGGHVVISHPLGAPLIARVQRLKRSRAQSGLRNVHYSRVRGRCIMHHAGRPQACAPATPDVCAPVPRLIDTRSLWWRARRAPILSSWNMQAGSG